MGGRDVVVIDTDGGVGGGGWRAGFTSWCAECSERWGDFGIEISAGAECEVAG